MMAFISLGGSGGDIVGAGICHLYQHELMNAAYHKVECAVRLRVW